MKLLVKLGGTLLDAAESRARLARELYDVQQTGVQLVIVHGGGKQMTQYLQDRGVESHFVGGLRVSTPAVIDAILKVIAGTINHELVASLVQAGAAAIGLSGIDAGLTEAVAMEPSLGAVGRPVKTNAAILDLLTANRYLPVVACVAGDRQGTIFNVNADQMAVSCASGFRADRLVFLTDVEGVRDVEGNTLDVLRPSDCARLIEQSVATGGMQAKLNAATSALENGIEEVVIAPGTLPGAVARILSGEAIGTRLLPEAAHA